MQIVGRVLAAWGCHERVQMADVRLPLRVRTRFGRPVSTETLEFDDRIWRRFKHANPAKRDEATCAELLTGSRIRAQSSLRDQVTGIEGTDGGAVSLGPAPSTTAKRMVKRARPPGPASSTSRGATRARRVPVMAAPPKPMPAGLSEAMLHPVSDPLALIMQSRSTWPEVTPRLAARSGNSMSGGLDQFGFTSTPGTGGVELGTSDLKGSRSMWAIASSRAAAAASRRPTSSAQARSRVSAKAEPCSPPSRMVSNSTPSAASASRLTTVTDRLLANAARNSSRSSACSKQAWFFDVSSFGPAGDGE